MNRIVKEHHPVDKLPEDLREGLDPHARARISVEVETDDVERRQAVLHAILAAKERGDWPLATDDPVKRIRKLRDEWND